ncbi:MAG: NAD(P)-dependent alcohol dehydrogenase [Flavobacteriales bacterium]|nr:NAD(P)-dependent alcohol dehydrogenase [Flavobacteriales bacterium]
MIQKSDVENMRAVVCPSYGPPEILALKQLPIPIPGPKEIRIRIRATSVNSGDVRVRGLVVNGFMRVVMRLVLGFRGPRNSILGTALAGVVDQVGSEVSKFKVGDEVYAMTGFRFGTYAEYIVLKESAAIAPKPVKASFEDAAAIIFGGATAVYFLKKAGITKGNQPHVLIYGASGSVGSAAVQVAKFFGAKVTAVCGARNAELMKSLGADVVLDYHHMNWKNEVEPADIVFDAVGKIRKSECRSFLTQGAKYVTVDGLDVASDSRDLLEAIAEIYNAGKLNPVIDKKFRLEEMVEAHRYVDTGKKVGNVAVIV